MIPGGHGLSLPEDQHILEVLHRFGVRRCYYGHIHSAGCARAVCGEFDSIRFQLVSADFLRFRPLLVEETV